MSEAAALKKPQAPKLKDRDIRGAVIERARFVAGIAPDIPAVLVEELSAGGAWMVSGQGARADVAVLTPKEFVAVEIKSDVDSAARLSDQARGYDTFFDRRVLVTKAARFETWHRTEGWRRVGYAVDDSGRLVLNEVCERRYDPEPSIMVAPACVLSTLWTAEIKRLATRLITEKRIEAFPVMKGRGPMVRRCAEAMTISEIRFVVMETLLSRKGGSFGAKATGCTAAKALP